MRLFLILALMAVPRLALARPNMADVAKKARSVSVTWIDSLPRAGCDPAYTDSLRFTRCNAVRALAVSPGSDWNRRLATLLRSEMSPWSASPCGFSARAFVAFQDVSPPATLAVFADRCDSTRVGLLMIRAGEPLEYRAMPPRSDNVLALLEETVRIDAGTEVAEVDEPPKPLQQPKPDYPRLARKQGIEGRVILQVLVGLDGTVKEVKVLRGIDGLNEAAIEAVHKWKFRPAQSNGKSIPCWVVAPVWFHF